MKGLKRRRHTIEQRSLHARKVKRVEALKRERDVAMRKLWDDFQARIDRARKASIS